MTSRRAYRRGRPLVELGHEPNHLAGRALAPKREISLADLPAGALEDAWAKVKEYATLKKPKQEVRDHHKPYVRQVVTGRCHVCDIPISGERRYCGPCLAVRL